MSYDFYKVAHFVGLFMVVIGLSAMLAFYNQSGGAKTFPQKRFLSLLHGVGMLIMFIAGFGLLARLQAPMATWVYGKITLWIILGLSPLFIRRYPKNLGYVVLLVVVSLAAFLARLKPL